MTGMRATSSSIYTEPRTLGDLRRIVVAEHESWPDEASLAIIVHQGDYNQCDYVSLTLSREQLPDAP